MTAMFKLINAAVDTVTKAAKEYEEQRRQHTSQREQEAKNREYERQRQQDDQIAAYAREQREQKQRVQIQAQQEIERLNQSRQELQDRDREAAAILDIIQAQRATLFYDHDIDIAPLFSDPFFHGYVAGMIERSCARLSSHHGTMLAAIMGKLIDTPVTIGGGRAFEFGRSMGRQDGDDCDTLIAHAFKQVPATAPAVQETRDSVADAMKRVFE